jgi:6-pyruvoyltetrahydropterin/6-carboxytetrahydropterin synthase
MRTIISRRIEWDMGHRIPNHESLCRNIHGHRYVTEIFIEGPLINERGDPEEGMVKDFSFLKTMLLFIPEELDHSFMIYKNDPLLPYLEEFDDNHHAVTHSLRINKMNFIPTAENIAAFIFRKLTQNCDDLKLVKVIVWETPNCKAEVTKGA